MSESVGLRSASRSLVSSAVLRRGSPGRKRSARGKRGGLRV